MTEHLLDRIEVAALDHASIMYPEAWSYRVREIRMDMRERHQCSFTVDVTIEENDDAFLAKHLLLNVKINGSKTTTRAIRS